MFGWRRESERSVYARLSRDHLRFSARERSPRRKLNVSSRVIYFITFACYGCHLHGEESGSVDRAHNLPGSRLLKPDRVRVSAERQRMDPPPYFMDRSRRETVLAALLERCWEQHWRLLAAHLRTNHVHMVV